MQVIVNDSFGLIGQFEVEFNDWGREVDGKCHVAGRIEGLDDDARIGHLRSGGWHQSGLDVRFFEHEQGSFWG